MFNFFKNIKFTREISPAIGFMFMLFFVIVLVVPYMYFYIVSSMEYVFSLEIFEILNNKEDVIFILATGSVTFFAMTGFVAPAIHRARTRRTFEDEQVLKDFKCLSNSGVNRAEYFSNEEIKKLTQRMREVAKDG